MKASAHIFRTVMWGIAVLLSGSVGAATSAAYGFMSEGQTVRMQILSQQDDVIWGFDFLPDGRILFTERAGHLRLLDPEKGMVQNIEGSPRVTRQGQGGLLDIRVHPDFGRSGWIYLTYSESVGDKMTTALGRGRLEGTELREFQKLFSAFEPNSNEIHFGSRIEFDGAGHIFMSVGDRNERDKAQSLNYDNGKILRLNEDGTAAAGNPFAQSPSARPEIWTYGHRNPQGLARHPATGELWSSEFGPRGGDEINRISPGANYGWPVITFGREYWGPRIGEGTAKVGMEQPVVYYVPSISPSGIAFYTGEAFPGWKHNLFVATLSGQHLRRLVIENGKVLKQEELLKDLDLKFRQVRPGPDGLLYFSTDDGKIGRLVPDH